MKSMLFTAATAAVLTIGILPAAAQTPLPHGANASKHGIAVIDVNYIFEKHDRFRNAMEQMKNEMQSIDTELKADRDRIAQTEEQRDTFNLGSAEYKQFDEESARMKADFQLKMTRLRKDFLEREAKVYYQTYVEISEAVKYYSERQGIGLVIRFNGDQPDPNQREAVLKEINKPVVFQDRVDITGDVIALLNREQAQTPGGQIPRR